MRYQNFLLFLIVFLVFAGCSNGSNTPLSPDLSGSDSGNLDNLPIIGGSVYEDGSFNSLGLMGAYELSIDPDFASAELVSKRMPSALGNSWVVSGIGFFTIAPCANCLRIHSIALTLNNELQIHFSIKHPFAPGDIQAPPSARNRLDLDVFDLKAVIKPIGATATNYPLLGTNIYANLLTNNAGFTTELANLVSDTAALPYALVVDKNAEPSAADWNEFPMGADSFFDVFFDLNTVTTLNFDLYLTMGYGASAVGKDQRLTPTYFNPEFNSKSPWKVMVTPPNGTNPPNLTNTWNSLEGTTNWPVTVNVFDWQHGVASIANPPVNTGDIAFASDVASVSIEIPGMTNSPKTATTPSSGTGSPSSPLVYQVQIPNERLLGVGEYIGLVKVTDSRVPPSPISGIDHLIDAPDGIELINYVIPEFATYQTFKATVVSGVIPNQNPIASAVATTPTNVYDGETVTFNASASSDPDGSVVLYEWDFNEDGTFAGVGDEYTGASHNPTHIFRRGDGIISVQLRVTDNLGAPDQLNSPINVTVNRSKNIVLREGVIIEEITCAMDRDEIFVLFQDKEVWKYNLYLQDGYQFAKFDDWGWGHQDPWHGRIQANQEGMYIITGFTYDDIGTMTKSYDPEGNEMSDMWFGYGAPENFRCEMFLSMHPTTHQAIGGIQGFEPGMPEATLGWFFMHPYNDRTFRDIFCWEYNGDGNVNYQYMRGACCMYTESDEYYFFVIEGEPEWRVERGWIDHPPFFEPGVAWGEKSDDENGFYDPQDIVIDSKDNLYIVDIPSNGEYVIKAFTHKGEPKGMFGDSTTMESIPRRIAVNWRNDWLYVSMKDQASLFFTTEHPY